MSINKPSARRIGPCSKHLVALSEKNLENKEVPEGTDSWSLLKSCGRG